ncbi:hypothetical protein ACP70R_021976 [Stipagrostis hirtigluma subsp. patula]
MKDPTPTPTPGLWSQGPKPPSPGSAPQSHIVFNVLHDRGDVRPFALEDAAVAVLPNPPIAQEKMVLMPFSSNLAIGGNLVQTGPDIAIPASSPIDFLLRLHDGNQKFTSYEEEYVKGVEIHCDNISVSFNNYNRPILETVNTPYGPVEVMFAILSNGVQGEVTVKLIRCDREDPTTIFRRIVARSKLFDAGCVLFYNENDKNISAGSEEPIPLARQVLAVPLYMPLSVELDLYCYSGDEIIRGSLEFEPEKEGQHMSRLAGLSGAVIEVAIAWSEYPW